MKSLKVIIEGKDEFEIKVEDKDLDTLIKVFGLLGNKYNPFKWGWQNVL